MVSNGNNTTSRVRVRSREIQCLFDVEGDAMPTSFIKWMELTQEDVESECEKKKSADRNEKVLRESEDMQIMEHLVCVSLEEMLARVKTLEARVKHDN